MTLNQKVIFMTISLLAMERAAKKAGAKRISKEALEEMRDAVEEIAAELAERSVRLARHAERKTVTAKDVRFIARVEEK